MDKKSGGSSGGGGRQGEMEFSSLPAVVLTESLGEDPFLPLSCELPECMLPINGIPTLTFMIEMLLKNGVTEIYLLTYSFKELLNEHIQEMRHCMKELRSLVVQVIQLGVHCASVGDALRDLDCQADIQDDFLLVQGGILCATDIRSAIQMHKRKRFQTPSLSMTLVFAESPPLSALRTNGGERVVIYDKDSGELVHWDRFDEDLSARLSLKRLLRNSGYTNIDFGSCEIRYDLLDIGMAICSPQLLKTFCETFDFTDLFEDYVQSTLSSDIKQDIISVSVMSHYSVRISDFRTYHVAQQHICEGWGFPLVPDYCSMLGQNMQRHQGMSVYVGEKANISPSSEISSVSVIGRGSRIGENCKISDSFIGRYCNIGNNCVIRGCSILDGVEIGDNVHIDYSFISGLVNIENDSKILSSIVGPGIHLGKDSVIGPSCRISRYVPRSLVSKDISGSEGGSSPSPTNRRRYMLLQEEGDDINKSWIVLPKEVCLSEQSMRTRDVLSSVVIFDSSLVREEGKSGANLGDWSGDGNKGIYSKDDSGLDSDSESELQILEGESDLDEDSREFLQECRMLVKSGLENPIHMPNKILELKGLRFAFFKDDLDVLDTCMSLILELLEKDSKEFLEIKPEYSGEIANIDMKKFSDYCREKGIIELISAFNRVEEEPFTLLICSKMLNFLSKQNSEIPFGALLVTFEKLDLVNQSFVPIWYDITLEKEESLETDQSNSRMLEILKSDFLIKYIEWIKDEDEDEDDN